MEKVDAGEHLPLISRVIGQMSLTGDMAEEAFSEGMVALVEASQSFNPDKGVPLANWLAMNIRWDIKTWVNKQHRTWNVSKSWLDAEEIRQEIEFTDVSKKMDINLEFNELIKTMEKVLTERERQILLADAFGYSGKRIAQVLGISQVQVSKIKKRAQNKLRKE